MIKKALKIALAFCLTVVVLFGLVVFFANFVFTKTMYFSCSGTTEFTVTKAGKVQNNKEESKVSMKVALTQYPFSAPFAVVNTENDLFLSDSNAGYLMVITDQLISGGRRDRYSNNSIFKGFRFNRITQALELETKFDEANGEDFDVQLFKGACVEKNPV